MVETRDLAEGQTGAGGRGVLANVQAIRAVAALLVVFVHLDVLLGRVGLSAFGDAGVDIFFVISGFIMVYTTNQSRVTPLQFAANRLARIAPIYWALTLAVFVLALAAPALFQATKADAIELIKSLVFIPFAKSNGLVTPVLFVGWTLNYEMFFYLLFAIGLAFPRYWMGLLFTCAALAMLATAGLIARPGGVLGHFYTDSIMVEFAIGIAIAAAFGARTTAASPGAGAKILVAAITLAALAAAVLLPLVFEGAPRLLTSGLAAGVVVSGAVWLDRAGASLTAPLALALGNASYSIYLTHPFVTQAGQKLADRVGVSPAASALMILCVLVMVCVVGYGVYRCLERPLTNAARRLLRGPAATARAARTP